jgi:PhnB protein
MATKAKSHLPEGFTSVTPHLAVKDAAKAIEWYKKALGAEELSRMPGPDGSVMHAELKVGDSLVLLAPDLGFGAAKSPQNINATSVVMMVYVPDVDAAYKRAVDNGAKPFMPVQDMFWGDRYGTFLDPFGHAWSIATHKEDLTPEEMMARAKDSMKNFA